jgi:hypothetical protein
MNTGHDRRLIMHEQLVVRQLTVELHDRDADDNATADHQEDPAAEQEPAEGEDYQTMRSGASSVEPLPTPNPLSASPATLVSSAAPAAGESQPQCWDRPLQI